jgi:hypothetical protein
MKACGSIKFSNKKNCWSQEVLLLKEETKRAVVNVAMVGKQ